MVKSSSLKLPVILGILAVAGLTFFYFTSSDFAKTNKEANRFYAVASQGTHLLDAIREAPAFHGIYFGGCAHIEKALSSGEEHPFVFVPKVGERKKFRTVMDALEQNPAMLRDYPDCRNVTVVFMNTFPFRGVVAVELDGKGYVKKALEPVYSN